MAYYIEKKYITLISSRVENFHWKSGQLANGRCPICHDSARSKKKSRLYFINRNDGWHVYCHNCNYSSNFRKFLERIDSQLHSEMMSEILVQKKTNEEEHFESFKTRVETDEQLKALNKLKTIFQLDSDHEAKKYIQKRKIPLSWSSIFRWCPEFNRWINNSILPGKFDDDALNYIDGRIIIPSFDSKGHFHALQGRSLSSDHKLRYIQIVIDKSIPPLWGLDRIDLKKKVFVFEGVFDALYIPNALAMCGGNYNALTTIIKPDNAIIVYDFEPHSIETKNKIKRAIEQGFSVFIPPCNLPGKDINELIMNGGMSVPDIERMIRNPFFHHEGLKALTKLAEWSKR